MKWLVVSGFSAWFALGCSGAGVDGSSAMGGPFAVGGTSSAAGSSYGAASGVPVGGSGGASAGGQPGEMGSGATTAAGSSSLPMGGAENSGCGAAAGSSTLPMGGYGATAGSSMSAGGEAMGGYGAGGSVDPNSCSHDVARCFDAAAACFENSPWSNCEQIVEVCAAMESECTAVGGMMPAAGTGGSSN